MSASLPQEGSNPTGSSEPPSSDIFIPPPLPHPFTHSSPAPILIAHGAEGLLYKTSFLHPDTPAVLKHRPPKSWRHPILDARLTKHRILSEARILIRCRKEGVPVPAVLGLDTQAGWLVTEFISHESGRDGKGLTIREGLERWNRRKGADGRDSVRALLKKIGEAVGRLHKSGIVHGDLTSSNLMLRSPPSSLHQVNGHDHTTDEQEDNITLDGEVILIDFGLASTSLQEEDRAVDLYVLERAMGSTHPWLEDEFGLMLDGYRGSYRGASITLKRLEDVRMRGRKKSMLG